MHYTKMHGAGNSFVIIENLHNELQGGDLRVLALRLCNPETGPGADGMIVLVPSGKDADFGMLFYNSDGSLGEMCGNGARCAARYGFERGLASDPDHICIQATAGLVTGKKNSTEQYEIRLNNPSVIDLHCCAQAGSESVLCSYIELGSPGIPHAVVPAEPEMLDNPESIRNLASALRFSPSFPKGANITFVSPSKESFTRAITFERGVEDFTLACGTGCAATAVALMLNGTVIGEDIDILMPGGMLHVRVHRDGNTVQEILLTGPTAYVGSGRYSI
jgi:diaminopimelate epimerase